MSKNIVQPDQVTDDSTGRRMRFAWLQKYLEYLMLFHKKNIYANAPQYCVLRA